MVSKVRGGRLARLAELWGGGIGPYLDLGNCFFEPPDIAGDNDDVCPLGRELACGATA